VTPSFGDASLRSDAHLAFVGGCQVGGFPVGATRAFPHLVVHRLGEADSRATYSVLQPVSLRRLPDVRLFLGEQNARVVVLQLGNFETGLKVSSLWRRRFGGRGLRAEGSTEPTAMGAYQCQPDLALDGTGMRRGPRGAVRTSLHRLWLHRWVDVAGIAAGIDAFARAVSADQQGLVVVIDPLPAADTIVERYRAEVRALLPEHPTAYTRLDLRDADAARNLWLFADPFHLSAKGHEWLADRLTPLILTPLSIAKAGSQAAGSAVGAD